MSSAEKPSRVRDYIYLDTDRAKSIYSQLRRGLMQSYMKGNASSEKSSKASAAKNQTVEQNVLLGTSFEETHVLHDFLYTEIESDLSEVINEIESLKKVEGLKPGDYFRICGRAQIDDTARFLRILKDMNALHSHISMAVELAEMQKEIWDKQNQLDYEVLNKRDADKLKKEIESLKPPAIFRKAHQGVPDLTADMITLWLDLLYPGTFEIKIQPNFSEHIIFRGIVDREYLREDPSLTYAKHSSGTQANWTLVGQVTAIYSPKQLASDEEDEEDEPLEDADLGNMRDSFENVFKTFKPMEEHILVSATHETVVATPLAIYQEISIK